MINKTKDILFRNRLQCLSFLVSTAGTSIYRHKRERRK